MSSAQADAQAASPWAHAGLSAATQQALNRTQQGYPRHSPDKGSQVWSAGQPLKRDSRQNSNMPLDAMEGKANQRSAVQQVPKGGGLDSIFARMSSGRNDESLDQTDDDSDARDGNLLGGQEDSLYEAHYNWKRDKR